MMKMNSNIFISDNLSRFPWSKAGNICVLILHSVDGASNGTEKKAKASGSEKLSGKSP